jgi:hypothetical protein
MSLFPKLMIGGWLTTFAMIGYCAACESGRLVRLRERIEWWLDTLKTPVADTPEEGLQPEFEEAA